MNNERRRKVKEAVGYITKSQTILQNVCFDEEMAFDNLSEGLQCTMRGEQMEENVETLDNIIEKIEEILELIDDIN